jgi:hypothetical protein
VVRVTKLFTLPIKSPPEGVGGRLKPALLPLGRAKAPGNFKEISALARTFLCMGKPKTTVPRSRKTRLYTKAEVQKAIDKAIEADNLESHRMGYVEAVAMLRDGLDYLQQEEPDLLAPEAVEEFEHLLEIVRWEPMQGISQKEVAIQERSIDYLLHLEDWLPDWETAIGEQRVLPTDAEHREWDALDALDECLMRP